MRLSFVFRPQPLLDDLFRKTSAWTEGRLPEVCIRDVLFSSFLPACAVTFRCLRLRLRLRHAACVCVPPPGGLPHNIAHVTSETN